MQHRLEDGVAHVVGLHLRDRSAFVRRRADLAANLLHAWVVRQLLQELRRAVVELLDVLIGEHDVADQFRVGADARADVEVGRELKHLDDRRFDLCLG